VTCGALVLAALDAIGPVIWYSMLQVLPAEGGAEGRCRRRVAALEKQIEVGLTTASPRRIASKVQQQQQHLVSELGARSKQCGQCTGAISASARPRLAITDWRTVPPMRWFSTI